MKFKEIRLRGKIKWKKMVLLDAYTGEDSIQPNSLIPTVNTWLRAAMYRTAVDGDL